MRNCLHDSVINYEIANRETPRCSGEGLSHEDSRSVRGCARESAGPLHAAQVRSVRDAQHCRLWVRSGRRLPSRCFRRLVRRPRLPSSYTVPHRAAPCQFAAPRRLMHMRHPFFPASCTLQSRFLPPRVPYSSDGSRSTEGPDGRSLFTPLSQENRNNRR